MPLIRLSGLHGIRRPVFAPVNPLKTGYQGFQNLPFDLKTY